MKKLYGKILGAALGLFLVGAPAAYADGTVGDLLGDIMAGHTMPKLDVDASYVALFHGHRYFLYSGVCDTWEEAKIHCENFGGHLVTIENEEENRFLCQYVIDQLAATPNWKYTDAYIGLVRTETGAWAWVDGTPVTYTNWQKGQPSEKKEKKYARITSKKGSFWDGGGRSFGETLDVLWVADKFKKGSAFICEWDTDEDWKLAKLYMEENF